MKTVRDDEASNGRASAILIMKMRIIGIEDFSSCHRSMITLVLDVSVVRAYDCGNHLLQITNNSMDISLKKDFLSFSAIIDAF